MLIKNFSKKYYIIITSLFVISACVWMQMKSFPNHDVAWILWGSNIISDGGLWGVDIIEPNPPLAWYISMPIIYMAKTLRSYLNEIFVFATSSISVISAFLFTILVDKSNSEEKNLNSIFVSVLVFLLLFPYRDFGQREHLAIILALPYFALANLRCGGAKISMFAAVLIGIFAGIGFALKPYFLAVPFMVEASVALSKRRWTSVIRPETMAIGCVAAVYGAYLFLIQSTYIKEVIPLAHSIYWSFNRPIGMWIWGIIFPTVFIGIIIIFSRNQNIALPIILSAATIGFVFSCIIQQKGYTYHVYPIFTGAALAGIAYLAHHTSTGNNRLLVGAMLGILLIKPVVATADWWHRNGTDGARTKEIEQLVACIDKYARNGRFLVVSVHPFPAFPTALYVNAKYVSRTNSQWFLPAVVQSRSSPGRISPRIADEAERNARRFIMRDLSQHPDLVIVDSDSGRHTRSRSDFNFLAFYKENSEFRAMWSSYEEVQTLGQYHLFVRRKGTHP